MTIVDPITDLNYSLILQTLRAQLKQAEFDAAMYARFGDDYPFAANAGEMKEQILSEIEKVEKLMEKRS